jgi:hypothetical protein
MQQRPRSADSVEKPEKKAASKKLPKSTANDLSRPMPLRIGCGDFQRIFRKTCWSPTSILSCRLHGAAKFRIGAKKEFFNTIRHEREFEVG